MSDLYTINFTFVEGTFVSQVEAESIDGVLELWLEDLRNTPIDHKAAPMLEDCKMVMDYFNSCTENEQSFEEQVHDELYPEIGSGETPTALRGLGNAWAAFFLIQLTDDEHHDECPIGEDGESYPNCPACEDDASCLGELTIVKTMRG